MAERPRLIRIYGKVCTVSGPGTPLRDSKAWLEREAAW